MQHHDMVTAAAIESIEQMQPVIGRDLALC
jgi:hypothetical protein